MRLFFQPSLAPIFFQLLPPSVRPGCGLVPGDTSLNAVFEVGGVLGGVMGSKAEPAGEGESVLSSVRPSGASVDVAAEEEET